MSENQYQSDISYPQLVNMEANGSGGYRGVFLWNGTYVAFSGKGFIPTSDDEIIVKRPFSSFIKGKFAELQSQHSERRLTDRMDRLDRCILFLFEQLDLLHEGGELKAGAAWSYVLQKSGMRDFPPTDYNYFLMNEAFGKAWNFVSSLRS
jgi:hypothetical protein